MQRITQEHILEEFNWAKKSKSQRLMSKQSSAKAKKQLKIHGEASAVTALVKGSFQQRIIKFLTIPYLYRYGITILH